MSIGINFINKNFQEDEEKIKQTINNAYLKSKSFFNINIEEISIDIVYTRQKFNELVGRETQDWEIGCSKKNKKIIIISESVLELISTHSKSNFLPVVTHELVHIFTNQLFGYFNPIWLYEGLAGYVSGQYKTRKLTLESLISFEKIFNQEEWSKRPSYSQAYLFTNFLFNKFGKEKMFNLFSKLNNPKIRRIELHSEFKKIFLEVLQTNLDIVISDWKNVLFG